VSALDGCGALPHEPGADGVILDPTAGLDDDAAIRAAWADFETYLLCGLDDAWTLRRRWREDDLVAASRLHRLSLVLDDLGRVHVFVAPRAALGEGEARLARTTLAAASSRIFERLARRWPLQVRRGPFETAPWRPARQAAAAA
jgi:hypothetical protein